MEVLRPESLTAALAAMAAGAVPVAGGTALQLDWSRGVARPGRLVSLGGMIPTGIEVAGGRVTIGAGCTIEALVAAGLPLLSRAARDVAAQAIRRQGTLGGTLGWGAGCLIPALMALGAEVETTAGRAPVGGPLPGGVILRIGFDLPPAGAGLIWRKIGLRAAFTPAVIVVAGVAGDALRLAVGGGPVRPQRLPRAEAALQGTALDRGEVEALIEAEIDAPDDVLRSARYRRRAAARVLAQGLTGSQGDPDSPLPLPEGALGPGGADWHTRPDMAEKIAGTWPFLTDRRADPSGRPLLVARILRAGVPHARLVALDVSAAEALSGVVAVVTARDIPGQNAFGIMQQDQPALADTRIRYAGEALAAVAAVDEATAEAALAMIRVTLTPLPPVTSPEAALAPDAPPLHPGGNLVTELGLTRGDPEAAFARAAHVVEDVYETPRQMHAFLETEGGWAAPDGAGGLIVAVGGQHGARDRMQLSRILSLPEGAIRVITSPTGGAFGGKDELSVQPALALLALKAGRGVRLQLSRAESVLAGQKRNPMTIRMRTACDAEGRLLAQEVEVLADSGAYASLSPAVLETALEHAAGPYEVPHVRTRGRLAYTNNGICGAFRGFGANQMTHAVECQMDRLAAQAGLSPAGIRALNLRRPGAPGFLGQRVAGSERLAEVLAQSARSPLWLPPATRGEWTEATGMALMWQGNGLGTLPEDVGAGTLRLAPDGRIEVLSGLDEMGQGLQAGLVAAAAEALGCARGDLRAITGDTGRTPDSGSTTASRGGYVVWRAVALTAPDFARQMCARAGAMLGLPPEALHLMPGGIGPLGANAPAISYATLAEGTGPLPEAHARFAFPKTEYTHGNARLIFASAATVVRVRVSRVTGEVRVTDLHLHTAAGPIIDLASYLGQMEGALIQGQGLVLSEDVPYADGRPLVTNFDGYILPGLADVAPRLAVTAEDSLDPGDPFGPRGAGELGIGGIAPAIANALLAATGRPLPAAPIPPEMLLEALA